MRFCSRSVRLMHFARTGAAIVAVVVVAMLCATTSAAFAAAPLGRSPLLSGSAGEMASPLRGPARTLRRRPHAVIEGHTVVKTFASASADGDSATDTMGVDPDASTCDESGYINFEGLPNHYDLSASAIGGVEFTTTNGYTWEVGDFESGEYNGKFPEGDYTSQGSNWAWLGEEEGAGRMTFVNGPASSFSILVSAADPVELEAFNARGELLATVGMSSNIDTGTMDELEITRSTPEMAYVVVRGVGNFFLVDSVCTDAPGTYTTPVGGAVGDQMSGNPSMNSVQCEYGDYPVNCATGDFWHMFTDASTPGRGLPLAVTRTYNSALASDGGSFGFGWSSNVTMAASFDAGDVTIHQEDGTTVTFEPREFGEFTAPPSVLATLVKEPDGSYVFTRKEDERYVFSASGQLIEESERNGNTTTFSYNGSGELTAETDPSGRVISFTYTGSGQVASVTDPESRRTSYVYDMAGDLVEVVDPLGRHWQFTYDSEHRMLTMREPKYFGDTATSPTPVVANTYDPSGRVIAQSDPMGRTTTFDYTSKPGSTIITDPMGNVTGETYAAGELVSITKGIGTPQEATWQYTYNPATLGVERVVQPGGQITTNAYDEAGNMIATTDPLGRTSTYMYNELDEPTTETDPLGVTTTHNYDEHGNLLETATPLEETGEVAVTTYAYEAEPGELTAVADPDGGTSRYGYDSAGNRTNVTDPDGNTTTYTYDTDGNLTSTVAPIGKSDGDPAAHTTSSAYNADGELVSETDPLGHVTGYAYDANGNRMSVTDAAGHTTKRAYDADNELIEVTRPDGSVLKTEWDPDGTMTKQIDAAGHATTYTHDPLNRLVSVTDPDGHVTSESYDADGLRTATINAEGEATEYGYDAAGELTSIGYTDGSTPDVTESYNADGERTEMTDGSGTSSFTYDSLGHMTSATAGAGVTASYSYDLDGHLTSLIYPNGRTVTRAYDAAGNLTSVTDWQGHTTDFSYDADSQLSQEQSPGDVITALRYDDADRLMSITDSHEGSTLASFGYSRNPAGLVSSESTDNGTKTTTNYSYDTLDHLTSAGEAPYGYDASDNPTTFGAVTQTFDPANELRSSTGGSGEGTGPTGEEPPSSGGESPSSGSTGGGQPSTGGSTSTPGPTSTPGGGALAFNAVSPAADGVVNGASTGGERIVTSRLHTHGAHDLVLALISAAPGQRAVAISGDRLHWSLLAHASGPGGVTQVWQAHASARLAGPVKIHLHARGRSAVATIAAFAGPAGASPAVLAHSAAQGRSSAPEDSLVPSAGALLWAVGHSVGQARPIAPHAGQQLVAQRYHEPARTDSWVQRISPISSAHVADTTTSGHWTLLAISIGMPAQAARAIGTAGRALSAHPALSAPATSASPQAPPGEVAGSTARMHGEGRAGGGATASTRAPLSRRFTYNARGDRIEEATTGSAPVQLSYDQADRLIAVGKDAEYAYNGAGLRVSKTVGAATTQFVWGEAEALPELLQAGSTYYIYGAEGVPIEQVTEEVPTYLHQDQQSSTRLMTDGSGAVVGRYDYSAWGAVTTHTGATTDLQFDGQYTDAETGFQYLRARYYDPSTGQFLTADPAFAATQSRYGYAANSPLDLADPLGLFSWSGALHTAGLVIGAVGIGAAVCAATLGAGCVAELGIGVASLTVTELDLGVVSVTVAELDASAVTASLTGAGVAQFAAYAGLGIDVGATWADCRGGSTAQCYADYGQDALDLVTFGAASYYDWLPGTAGDVISRLFGLGYAGVSDDLVRDRGAGGSPLCSPVDDGEFV